MKIFFAVASMTTVLNQQATAMDVILFPEYLYCLSSEGSDSCRYWSATGELTQGIKKTRAPILSFLAALPFAFPFTILNEDGSVAKQSVDDNELLKQGYSQDEINEYHAKMSLILNKFSNKVQTAEANKQVITVEDYKQTVYESNPTASTLEIMGL